MKVIGVSGPIGTGKSSVIAAICSDARLAHDLGGAVLAVDADATLRAARNESPALRDAIFALVPAAQRADGSLDAERLAELAFADRELLTRLEALQWPIARAAIRSARAQGEASGAALLLVEAIALVASGLVDELDGILLLDAPRELRQARAFERGMRAEHFAQREAAQSGLSDRLLAAGAHPIDARGTVAEVATAAGEALRLLCSTGEAHADPTD